MASLEHTNKGPGQLATYFVTLGIAVPLVFLRLYIRITNKTYGWDDYTIVLALVRASSQ